MEANEALWDLEDQPTFNKEKNSGSLLVHGNLFSGMAAGVPLFINEKQFDVDEFLEREPIIFFYPLRSGETAKNVEIIYGTHGKGGKSESSGVPQATIEPHA